MQSALITTTYKCYFSLALIYRPSTCLIQIGNRSNFYNTSASNNFLTQLFASTENRLKSFFSLKKKFKFQ